MIDNLPNGWKVEKLEDITEFITCGVAKRPEYVDESVGIPFLSSKNVKENKLILNDYNYVSFQDYKQLTKYYKPQKGDILYTRVGSFGESVVINIELEFAIFVSLTIIRVKQNIINSYYLSNFLNSNYVRQIAMEKARGIGVKNLNVSDVREYTIPIPPLEQQEKIVKVLDLTSNLIEKQKELLEKYDLFLKSKFIEMFGDPITNPMGWENDVLSNVCPNKGDFVDGPFGSDLKVSDRTDEGIRIIQINNVGENEFRDKNKAFIRQEKYLTLKRHEVLQNDIIIAKMGEPIARSCFLPKHIDKAIIVADCMRMRITNNDYNRVFICFYLNFYTTKVLIDNLSHGSTRTRINLSILKTLEIIKPKVELQNKFALIVEKIETIKEKENQKLKQMNDLHNSMMNKAFKGEIK
ncbi:restriction endonuclease subunit S [Aliarcobacter butzleri]|uniref:restriction endonuclease subunit S n=1 Tax=Aliarcobacter butzleri TaxID=28197 RepID=UPI00263CC824|nr:restriction endonuclease subunit S [Aliarcobacter butzleri]MDN5112109.1 restriction endonuclease subunit S [Aliarcobacter butzleri]